MEQIRIFVKLLTGVTNMPKKVGTELWRKQRLQAHLEQKLYRYYIFCEGEKTEPLYFDGFKSLIEDNPIYREMVLIEIEPCGAETLRVVQQAEKYVEKHNIEKGQIWCVYDKDSFPAEHFNAAQQRIEELNQQSDNNLEYHAAWSNECIEFWFLLHFVYYTANNSRSEYIKTLNHQYSKCGLMGYKKNDKETFSNLLTYGSPKAAIRNAIKILQGNGYRTPSQIAPGTKVYELVIELAKYLPEEVRERFI